MDKEIIGQEPSYCEEDDTSSRCSMVGSETAVDYMDYNSIFTNEKIFKSKEALIKWTQEVGKRNGIVVVTIKSDMGSSGRRPKLTLGCERGDSFKKSRNKADAQDEKRAKMICTKNCGCPFTLIGKKLCTDEDHDDWRLMVSCGVHNHPVAKHLEGHSYAGRTEEDNSLFVNISKSLVRPKEDLFTLKHLLSKLEEHKYIESHRSCNNTDTVRDLFWAHRCSLDLLRVFPGVLIMDCSHKTRRFGLPLFQVVGVTSTEMTFPVANAYLEYEQEENYTWALSQLRGMLDDCVLPDVIVTGTELSLMKAIERVFPTARQLLCKWHIGRNVSTKCKKFFETKVKWKKFDLNWGILVSSSTKYEYTEHLVALKSTFSTYPEALLYIETSWLNPYKERFVAAWTNTCMHRGNLTSKRAKGALLKLNKEIGSSKGTFEECWKNMHDSFVLMLTEIKASFTKSVLVVQHNHTPTLFSELRNSISRSALDIVFQQSELANTIGVDASACGCVIRRTHGLPCAHEIAEYKREGRPIPLDCIDPHWRKLNLVPVTVVKKEVLKFTCQAELELIRERFNKSDTRGKEHILKKIRELVNPHSNSFVEPVTNVQRRDQPKEKIDPSTRCDPYAFEFVISTQDRFSPGVMGDKAGPTGHMKEERLQKLKVIPATMFMDTSSMKVLPSIYLFDSFRKHKVGR